MAPNEDDNMQVVPIQSSETQDEHDRIRSSNERDQEMERDGRQSPHARGYDEAADGPPTLEIARVVDE